MRNLYTKLKQLILKKLRWHAFYSIRSTRPDKIYRFLNRMIQKSIDKFNLKVEIQVFVKKMEID
jgi:hypothetical protein